MFQKFLLAADNTGAHLVDGLFALVDASQKIDRRTELFSEKTLGLAAYAVALEKLLIRIVQPQVRHPLVVQKNNEFVVHFGNRHLGLDVSDLLRIVFLSRRWNQMLDDV